MAIKIDAAFGVRQGPYVWRCTDCAMQGAAARGTDVIIEAHAHLNTHAAVPRTGHALVEAS